MLKESVRNFIGVVTLGHGPISKMLNLHRNLSFEIASDIVPKLVLFRTFVTFDLSTLVEQFDVKVLPGAGHSLSSYLSFDIVVSDILEMYFSLKGL
jgi:hypothetical protein